MRNTKNIKIPSSVERILWVRPDSIGDNVLSASMLPHIKEKFKKAEIHVLCQSHLYDFYTACPYITEVIGFDQQSLLTHVQNRNELLDFLHSKRYDISINSVYSKSNITDFLSVNTGAQIKITHMALPSTYTEMSAVDLYNNSHDILVSSPLSDRPTENMHELERHQFFMKALGCDEYTDPAPLIWIPAHAEMRAEKIFEKNGLDPSKTVVLSPGVQFSPRLHYHYCEAIEPLCKDEDLTLIVIGMERDRPVINRNLHNFKGKIVDLVGKTSLLEVAAIIKRSRMLVGSDSSPAHIACAVGTPNAIVFGGGHCNPTKPLIGRFFPYSSLNYCAVLHLDCFGCDWVCKFNRPICVRDVRPETLKRAIMGAYNRSEKKIYFQESL